MRKVFRYGAVGLVNTLVGYGTIMGAMALGASPLVANASGYAVGLCFSFVLNSKWTFENKTTDRHTLVRFLAAFALAYSANLGMLALLIGQSVDAAIAQATAILVYQVTFFLLMKFAVFAPRHDHREKDHAQL